MKSMITAMLIFVSASAMAQNACQQAMEQTRPVYIEVKEEQLEILKTAARLIHLIVKQKFEMADYLEKNASVYGEYAAQTVQFTYLHQKEKELLARQDQWLTAYKAAVQSIDPRLPDNSIKRLTISLVYNQNQEMQLLREQLEETRMQLKETQIRVTNSYTQWSPYDLRLKELERLETSFMLTLEQLKKISNFDLRSLKETAQVLRDVTFEREEDCADFIQKFEKMRTDLLKPMLKF